MKPDQRTKGWLIEHGWTPWRTEVYHFYAKKKFDLFHICDYVALKPETVGVFGVQVTGASALAEHRRGLLFDVHKAPMLRLWLICRNSFEVHSWQKEAVHGRGKRKEWVLSREQAILSPEGQVSFEEIVLTPPSPESSLPGA